MAPPAVVHFLATSVPGNSPWLPSRIVVAGKCVDVFAPAVDIFAACGGASRCAQLSDDAYTWASGTSMAAPLVSGAAASYLSEHPEASAAEVRALMHRKWRRLACRVKPCGLLRGRR